MATKKLRQLSGRLVPSRMAILLTLLASAPVTSLAGELMGNNNSQSNTVDAVAIQEKDDVSMKIKNCDDGKVSCQFVKRMTKQNFATRMAKSNGDEIRIIDVGGVLVRVAVDPATTSDIGRCGIVQGIVPDSDRAGFIAPCDLNKVQDLTLLSRIDVEGPGDEPETLMVRGLIEELKKKGYSLAIKKEMFAITCETEIRLNDRPNRSGGKKRNRSKFITPTATDSLTISHPPDDRWGTNCYYQYRKGKS